MNVPRSTFRLAVLAAIIPTLALGIAAGSKAKASLPPNSRTVPEAATSSGIVIGREESGVEVFRGIPYAAPPTGELRWRAPQPAPAWKGSRTAFAFGADCMQDTANNPMPPGHSLPASEDCLYLNVWRPAGMRAGQRLPVMVWVHGGAFIMGSGAMSTYDGAALARQGAIIVTINYRLGRFGNFTTPALHAQQMKNGEPSSNFWLMDQIAALRWVKTNAAAFGGDPARITAMGESAGAVSIATLLAVKQARGLFQQAIMESGSPRRDLVPLTQSEQTGLSWAISRGIARDDPAAMRGLSAQTVLDAPVTAVSEPVQDGTLLVEPPFDTFARGDAAKVPALIGANSWEESLLRWMPDVLPALKARLGPNAAEGMRLYDAARLGEKAALTRMWGDASMVEPARQSARLMMEKGSPVWLYHFSYVPQSLRSARPGAGHGDEIEFVFGNLSAQSRPGWTGMDQSMAKTLSSRWIAFAKTGKPQISSAPAWPQLAHGDDVLLHFTNDGEKIEHDFEKAALDFISSNAGRSSLYKSQ